MTALIINTFPTLPTAESPARRSNLATLDQSELNVTGDIESSSTLDVILCNMTYDFLKESKQPICHHIMSLGATILL